jgi:hypothetical protein
MTETAAEHGDAANRHEQAAQNHDRAARFWNGRGDHQRTELRRELAEFERRGAELERRWANLVSAKQGPSSAAKEAILAAGLARSHTREGARRLGLALNRMAEVLDKTAVLAEQSRASARSGGLG